MVRLGSARHLGIFGRLGHITHLGRFGFLGFIGFVAIACVSGYEILSTDISPERWDETVVMQYDNSDTLTIKELSLSLRHNIEVVPAPGLYVVGTTSPSGAQTRDTLRLAFSGKDPRLEFGSEFGSDVNNTLRETTVRVRSRAPLPEKGEWIFTVTPLQPTRGVWSVAFSFK
jgi:hypothetical protein